MLRSLRMKDYWLALKDALLPPARTLLAEPLGMALVADAMHRSFSKGIMSLQSES
jgi:hypothetical protein